MKLLLAIVLFTAEQIAADPTSCNFCFEEDAATCSANQRQQTCATDPDSLGTTHCGTAVGKYKDGILSFKKEGVFRGCINCADKKAACFALGGYLEADKSFTLLECEIECCTDNNCNTQTPPTLSQAAIDVFTPSVHGQLTCKNCIERDAQTCSTTETTQICATSSKSLGTTHCGSAVGKYRDENGNIKEGFIRGCIDCADKKAACAILGGALKARLKWTLLQCEIECCKGNNCNTQVPTLPPPAAGPTQCNFCFENDAATCSANQRQQTCATDPDSLGTTHCGSAVGKYHDASGNVKHGFTRGCINCADKNQACESIANVLKRSKGWTLIQCDIECCTEDKCNTQVPKLVEAKPGNRGGRRIMVGGVIAFATSFAIMSANF